MEADRFWQLIDQARQRHPPERKNERLRPSADPEALAEVLRPLTNEEVYAFGMTYNRNLLELNHWDVWAAGYIIAGGLSDDGFHYFRSWLIGKGKEVVELAKRDPDALGLYIDDEEVDNEGLEYVTLDILGEREIEEDPRDADEDHADDPPKGERFDEETVEKRFRKLAAKFG